jgi:ferrous iron transport protein B
VIDTPGMYGYLPISQEEQVSRQLLENEQPGLLINVVDGKNLSRMLNFTLQLIEAGFAVILTVNLLDEARRYGLFIDTGELSAVLHIPVIPATAVKREGLAQLKKAICQHQQCSSFKVTYPKGLETAINQISGLLTGDFTISTRMAAILLLSGDKQMVSRLQLEPAGKEILTRIREIADAYEYPLEYVIAMERQRLVDSICGRIIYRQRLKDNPVSYYLGRWSCEPLSGMVILCLVLVGIYELVGNVGAGYLVDFIDKTFYLKYVKPFTTAIIYGYIPMEWLQSVLIGKYGIISMGLRYALVIIMPIVGSYFLTFAILEDSGYLPRLAMLLDRVFKIFGLNGRAVIPFILGLGCGTMGVLVTRTLETKRERLLTTFLLALAVPCSAQLGIVLSLLAGFPWAFSIWILYLALIFIVAGYIGARTIPGQGSAFYMELPEMRLPAPSQVIAKAWMKMLWYFIEILPVFVVTSLFMWFMDYTNLLGRIIISLQPVMLALGLPPGMAEIIITGFFRRDYGAAGLYDMCGAGRLNQEQLLVACVIMTLFMPCIAQVAVMIKERGGITAMLVCAIVLIIAFVSGLLVHELSLGLKMLI